MTPDSYQCRGRTMTNAAGKLVLTMGEGIAHAHREAEAQDRKELQNLKLKTRIFYRHRDEKVFCSAVVCGKARGILIELIEYGSPQSKWYKYSEIEYYKWRRVKLEKKWEGHHHD